MIGLFVGGVVVAAVFIGLITGRVIIKYKCKCKRKDYEQLLDHATNIATNSWSGKQDISRQWTTHIIKSILYTLDIIYKYPLFL